MNKKRKGSIALLTVLVITGILLYLSITLAYSGLDNIEISSNSNNFLTKIRARSCLEEGLFMLNMSPSYTGTYDLTFSDGSCEINIENDLSFPYIKNVVLYSNLNNYNFQWELQIDTSQTPMEIINL